MRRRRSGNAVRGGCQAAFEGGMNEQQNTTEKAVRAGYVSSAAIITTSQFINHSLPFDAGRSDGCIYMLMMMAAAYLPVPFIHSFVVVVRHFVRLPVSDRSGTAGMNGRKEGTHNNNNNQQQQTTVNGMVPSDCSRKMVNQLLEEE